MAKNFKPNVGNKIRKKDAEEWIKKYDDEMRKDKKTDTKSVFYGRDALLKILSVDGSSGITFFLAMRYNEWAKKDTVQLVLVPTKEDGTLIWHDSPTNADALAADSTAAMAAKEVKDDSGGYDNGLACPPYCP